MKINFFGVTVMAMNAVMIACAGCGNVPGHPKTEGGPSRPEEVMDFQTLYKENCSGCHGENGRDGAAIALNNPAYLAYAGAENLRRATAEGVRGTLMPAFTQSAGGMLTDRQVDALVQGMLQSWSKPAEFAGVKLPAYAETAPGDVTDGQKVYASACARCHGADGAGAQKTAQAGATEHSIVDTSYLALVNDQSLRSIVVAGHPESKTPDWRSYVTGHALTEAEINDLVAWIGSHRPATNDLPVGPTGKAGKEAR